MAVGNDSSDIAGVVYAVGPFGCGDHLDEGFGLFPVVGFNGTLVLRDGHDGENTHDEDGDQKLHQGKRVAEEFPTEEIHTR